MNENNNHQIIDMRIVQLNPLQQQQQQIALVRRMQHERYQGNIGNPSPSSNSHLHSPAPCQQNESIINSSSHHLVYPPRTFVYNNYSSRATEGNSASRFSQRTFKIPDSNSSKNRFFNKHINQSVFSFSKPLNLTIKPSCINHEPSFFGTPTVDVIDITGTSTLQQNTNTGSNFNENKNKRRFDSQEYSAENQNSEEVSKRQKLGRLNSDNCADSRSRKNNIDCNDSSVESPSRSRSSHRNSRLNVRDNQSKPRRRGTNAGESRREYYDNRNNRNNNNNNKNCRNDNIDSRDYANRNNYNYSNSKNNDNNTRPYKNNNNNKQNNNYGKSRHQNNGNNKLYSDQNNMKQNVKNNRYFDQKNYNDYNRHRSYNNNNQRRNLGNNNDRAPFPSRREKTVFIFNNRLN